MSSVNLPSRAIATVPNRLFDMIKKYHFQTNGGWGDAEISGDTARVQVEGEYPVTFHDCELLFSGLGDASVVSTSGAKYQFSFFHLTKMVSEAVRQEPTKVIVKMEGKTPILFLPEFDARHGFIVCYAENGEHSEASVSYFVGLRPPSKGESELADAVFDRYAKNRCSVEGAVRVERDTRKMKEMRWTRPEGV